MRLLLMAALLGAAGAAWSHGDKPHGPKAPRPISTEEKEFGREGDPRKATRTVRVDMSDRMRFSPDRLVIAQGETVRFVVRNLGKAMHEMVIGTE